MAPIITRKRNWSAIMLFVIVGSALLIPSSTMSQDLSKTPEELSRERFEELSKEYSLSKPVLEALFEEHKELFGKFGTYIKTVNLLDKMTNDKDWDFVTALSEEAGGTLLTHTAPMFAGWLNALQAAKTAMELAKYKIVDPAFDKKLEKTYCSYLEPGVSEDAREAWANATVTPDMYILDIMYRNRKKFAKDLPSAFKKETATSVKLMPAWEDEFQDVLRAHYTERCRRRWAEQAAAQELAIAKKRQEEAEKKVRELLGASFCWRKVETKRKPPPKGCPSIFAFETGEGKFTYKATRPHHLFKYSFKFEVPEKICTKKWTAMKVTGTGSCGPCEGYPHDELSIITKGAKIGVKTKDPETGDIKYKLDNKLKLTHKDAKSETERTKTFEFTLADFAPEVVKLIVRSGSCFGNHRTWFYEYEKDTN